MWFSSKLNQFCRDLEGHLEETLINEKNVLPESSLLRDRPKLLELIEEVRRRLAQPSQDRIMQQEFQQKEVETRDLKRQIDLLSTINSELSFKHQEQREKLTALEAMVHQHEAKRQIWNAT
ncbi:hypothetical protein, partial [Pseudomonas aeruginosa]|uniref:hypothetical protein n=1 Tax=Pseudomonas aeruginosa TaxID=287 RepID=UPI0039685031